VNNSPYFEAVETDPTVFYVLLALAGAALAFLLVRRAMAQMVRSEKQHGRAATLEKLESPAAAMPRFAPGSPRERVRQSYRKFMRLLENRGAQLKEAQTTGEIHCENRHLTQEEAAGQLRELYLSARYDPNAQITSQQVRQARALVKEIESTPPG